MPVSESPGMPGFFDDYPRFYETGNTGPGPRLNARHECLIGRHVEWIKDRSILDIGSHNGRWSFAALAAGATRVLGIEARASLVEASERTFRAYGVARERFAFHASDVLAFLRHERVKVDTVFLFGFLYHVPYHVELLQELWRTGALTIILDSAVSPEQGSGDRFANTLSLIAERVDDISNAAYEIFPGAGTAIVALPSRAAITFLLQAFQFEVSEISWAPYVEKWGHTGLEDYLAGQRATFLARKRNGLV